MSTNWSEYIKQKHMNRVLLNSEIGLDLFGLMKISACTLKMLGCFNPILGQIWTWVKI